MVGCDKRDIQTKDESENEKSLRNIVRAGERKGVFYWATTVIGPITVVAHRTPVSNRTNYGFSSRYNCCRNRLHLCAHRSSVIAYAHMCSWRTTVIGPITFTRLRCTAVIALITVAVELEL